MMGIAGKNFKPLGVIFTLIYSHFALAGPNLGVSWSSAETGIIQQFQSSSDPLAQIVPSFAFNPVYSVNSNRGSFSTGFSLALPPNLTSLTKLSFQYDSSLDTNQGFGAGFQLGLPQLQIKNPGGPSEEIFLMGSLGHSKLLKTSEKEAGFDIYRPQVFVENQSKLGSFKRHKGEKYWVFDPIDSSEKMKFDQWGRLIQIEVPGQTLKLRWEQRHLLSISAPHFSARFSYKFK